MTKDVGLESNDVTLPLLEPMLHFEDPLFQVQGLLFEVGGFESPQ